MEQSESGHLAATGGDVPSAASEEAARPVAGAAPTEQEPPLVTRLRNTPNWRRESYGHWKDMTSEYDRAPFEAANEIERLQQEVRRLEDEIDRRKGDPSTRLHNICQAISEEADNSVFSREEWDRIDAENVELQKRQASMAMMVRMLCSHTCSDNTKQRAMELLRSYGLQGSPLR
jgi:predicted RNase H-like nuclease (RuvC/YqgF family)